MNERDDSVSLKEWTQELNEATRQRIMALEKHIEQLFVSSQRAVDVASEAMTIRLDHANGLIKQMKDQAVDFASRLELKALDDRLAVIEQNRAGLEGRLSGDIAPVRELDGRVAALERSRSNFEGTQTGSKPMRDLILVIIGAILSYVATKLLTGNPN